MARNVITVEWKWGPGASKALQSNARYIDLEGGIRAQKTTALCARALSLACDHPGMRLRLARYTEENTQKLLKPVWRDYCDKNHVPLHWNAEEGYDALPNGSRVYISGIKASDDAAKFSKVRGPTLAFVGVDQPEEMPEEFHGELVGRLSQQGYPQQLWYTPQPVNPDHWLAQVFPEDNPNEAYLYVRTNCYDNRVNLGDAYIAALEAAYPIGSAQRRTLLEGRRGLASHGTPVFRGYFNFSLHSRPVEMDPHVPLVEGWDWGHGHPCVVWAQFLPIGRLQILGAVMGQAMFLEDFAPVATYYRSQWCPSPLTILAAGDPSGLDSNNQGVRTTMVREILAEAGIHPQSVAHANTLESQFNVTQSLSRYMRKIALDGQPAFQVNPRAVLVSVTGGRVAHRPSDFVTAGLEAGLVWDEHAAIGMKVGVRRVKNDGLYDHAFRALAYACISYEPAQPTQQTLEKLKKRELRKAQQDDEPAYVRVRQPGRMSRGGY